MEKLKLHTLDFTQKNIARMADSFPNCITESRSDDGKVKLAVDFDKLRQELSDIVVDGPRERFHLDWPGKRDALLAANAPIAKTLRPCRDESVEFETTKNLFIEGDNLDALKLLQETYLNRVKMIYIDPPYNTGNDFIYEDDFAENSETYLTRSNQKDEGGNRLVTNTEANGRFHSDWLSMMYPRLKLARSLLSDDGVMFISIDDNEVHSLMRICSEIFGEENFIAQLAVQLNPRGRHLDNFVAKTHESILIFVKDAMNENAIRGIEKEGRMIEEYNRQDERGKYRFLGLRNRNQSFNPISRPKLYYPLFVNPKDGKISLIQNESFSDEVWPDAPDGTKTCWTWGKEKVEKESFILSAEKTGDEWRIYRKDYLVSEDGEQAKTLVKSVWMSKEITNDYGRKAIKDLFGSALMDFPKSPDLLKTLIQIGASGKDLVLDFFAGSSTTAHAIIDQNAADGGNRKFIMIQVPEPCDENSSAYKAGYHSIADLSKERVRLAGKRILEGEIQDGWNKDVGFRVLKVDTSNMKDVFYQPDSLQKENLFDHIENIKEKRTPEDLLFQVLLDWGVDLSLPIAKETIDGKTVFFVDQNALAACFETDITEELVRTLAVRKPLRAVFRDAGFSNDAVKINVEQIFKLMSPGTEIKSI